MKRHAVSCEWGKPVFPQTQTAGVNFFETQLEGFEQFNKRFKIRHVVAACEQNLVGATQQHYGFRGLEQPLTTTLQHSKTLGSKSLGGFSEGEKTDKHRNATYQGQ
jgi:hypothetical protein